MTDFIYAQDEAFIQGKSVEVCTFKEACLIQKVLEKVELSSVEKRALPIG